MEIFDESTSDSFADYISELKAKVLSGQYKISTKRGRSKVWSIFGSIETDYGVELPNYLVCRSCLNIYKYNAKATSNLVKHKCYVSAKSVNNLTFHEYTVKNATLVKSGKSYTVPKVAAFTATKNVESKNSTTVRKIVANKTSNVTARNRTTVTEIAAFNSGIVSKIATDRSTTLESSNSSTVSKIDDNATKTIAIELFTKWAIYSCRHFKIVEDSGLKEIAKFFASVGVNFGSNVDIMTYIPSPTAISHNVEIMYKTNVAKIRSEIATLVDVGYGLTSELWTDNFLGNSYLTVTIHFVKDGQNYSRLLGLKAMDNEKVTTENVHAMVVELLSDFGCALNNKAIMVTRSVSNMVSVFRPYNQLYCINHLLQNTLQKSMEEVEEISNICKLSIKIVQYLKKSGRIANFTTSLKSIIPTRWSTFYYLFLYIKNNWNEITQLMQERNESYRISELNVSLLNSLIEVLALFEEALKKLEDENYPTLHLVVVHIDKLLRTCSISSDDILIIKLFKEKILSNLQTMVLKNLSIFHKIALFLFPPANKLLKLQDEEKEVVRKATEKIMSEFTESLHSSISCSTIISEKNFDLFDGFVTQRDPTHSSDRASEELTMYENTIIHFYGEFDVLKWWDVNKYQFPLLYKTSCRILAVPASSAASEKVFSAARNLLTENKCVFDCDSEALSNIIFLHFNDFS